MNVIKIKQGLEFKMFNNWLDCPYRACCPSRESREKGLKPKYRCSLNSSIFDCKTYQEFNWELGVKEIKDIRYL